MHSRLGEVKIVTGIWMCFAFDPAQVQPQNRIRLFGWMSTAHWNGTVFRSGEKTDEPDLGFDTADREDSEPALVDSLQMEIEALKDQVNTASYASLEDEFLETVIRVENICKPRMLEREADITEKKLASLARALERAKQSLGVVINA